MQAIQPTPPPLKEDEFGVFRVGDTRVSLESVVVAFDNGATAEEIVDSFPNLDLATVYATLAFVLSNRGTIDEYLSRRREQVEQMRAAAAQRFPSQGLRQRLLSRRRSSSP
jgi:uncharacterized protein (DUF433 family)